MKLNRLRKCALSLTLAAAAATGVSPAAGQIMSISSVDNQLRVIDPATATTISALPVTLPGRVVLKGNGLAVHPQTCEVYALLSLQLQNGRELVTIDPGTGVATSIGNTGDKFAGLAFDLDGTLYGVTGDGAAAPENLYTLNTATAAPTFVMFLGNGDDGEAIAYNPDGSRLYHASGISVNFNQVFEHIDLQTLDITDVPISGDPYYEAQALMYEGNLQFLLSARDVAGFQPHLYHITTSGVVTEIGGPMDHVPKGLARLCGPPCPADLNNDQVVDVFDLSALLGVWGPYAPCDEFIPADIIPDCAVNAADLANLLGQWGTCE